MEKVTKRRPYDVSRLKQKETKVRRCLRCSKNFNSTGVGNRLCDQCRWFASEQMSGMDICNVQTNWGGF